MKILVTGGEGLLAKTIKKIDQNDIDFHFCSKSTLDVRNIKLIEKQIEKHQPNGILHCGALTRPMSMHNTHPILSIETNIIGTSNIAISCLKYCIKPIFISTDYVYSSQHRNNGHKENEALYGVNNYGWTKIAGESAIRMVPNHLILRCSFTDNLFPHNKAPYDSFKSFLIVDKIAPLILKLIIKDIDGIVNIGGTKQSIYNFAKQYKPNIKKISKTEIDKNYPKDTSLCLDKLHTILNDMKHKTTIIIPVLNRRHTLPRILNYYKNSNIPILVCDATKTSYKRINEFPWVEYLHKPDKLHVDFMVDVLQKINTPYSVNLADDDFLLIPAIRYCEDYLNKNKNCSAIMGQEAALYDNFLEFESDHFVLEQLEPMSFEDPKKRMEYAWKYFTAKNHAIIRTNYHLEVFKFMQDHPNLFAVKFLDKILSLILAYRGNIVSAPIFYNLRSGETKAQTMRNSPGIAHHMKPHLSFEKDFLKKDLTPLLNNVELSLEELKVLHTKLINKEKNKHLQALNSYYNYDYPKKNNCLYPIKMRKLKKPTVYSRSMKFFSNTFPIYNSIDEINKILSLVKEYPL